MGGKGIIMLYCNYLFGVGSNLDVILKAQLGLMAILVVSLGNFIVGSILGPTDAEEVAKGFVGFNCK